MNRHDISSPDGLNIACYESGNPAGPEIVFIHGFNQCAMAWEKQFASAELAGEFRLIAYDIRGHGVSGRPADLSRYVQDALFAADLHAVCEAFGLRRPVLVGWSYAGRIVEDYLRTYGTSRIAGINYVCARTNNDPSFNGPGTFELAAMTGSDLADNIRATRAFVRACFERQPSAGEFETILAYNMLMPAEIRRAHLGRPPSDGAIMLSIDVPVLVTQGSEDQLVLKGLGELTAAMIPGARLSIYEGVGHAPFAEDALRFNRELADFVRMAQQHREPRGAGAATQTDRS